MCVCVCVSVCFPLLLSVADSFFCFDASLLLLLLLVIVVGNYQLRSLQKSQYLPMGHSPLSLSSFSKGFPVDVHVDVSVEKGDGEEKRERWTQRKNAAIAISIN